LGRKLTQEGGRINSTQKTKTGRGGGGKKEIKNRGNGKKSDQKAQQRGHSGQGGVGDGRSTLVMREGNEKRWTSLREEENRRAGRKKFLVEGPGRGRRQHTFRNFSGQEWTTDLGKRGPVEGRKKVFNCNKGERDTSLEGKKIEKHREKKGGGDTGKKTRGGPPWG